MKIKGNLPQQMLTHSKGILVFQYYPDGRIVARKWPRKRGRPKSQVTRAQVATWDTAQQLVKNPEPQAYAIALADTLGTAFYARDILISAMYGNYVSWPEWGWRPLLAGNIQTMLDLISSTPGVMLVRGPSSWIALVPGTAGTVLTSNGAGADPSFQAITPPAATGLFRQVLSATPSTASTGLSTWLNQGSATITDAATGLALAAPSNGGSDNWRIRRKAAPATPYTITVLLTLAGNPQNFTNAGIGWYDGSAKLEMITYTYNAGWLVAINQWNSITSFHASPAPTAVNVAQPIWLRISDDGTNVTMSWSLDGSNWIVQQTHVKSTGWLGASGYSNVFLGLNPTNNTYVATLLSWNQTSP